MTLPVAHGYPDFGRYQARADVLLIREINTVSTAFDTRGPFFVAGLEQIAYIVSATTNGLTFNVLWWADAAATIPLGSQRVVVRAGGSIEYSMPVQGPWCTMTLTRAAAPCTWSVTAWTVARSLASTQFDSTPETVFGTQASVGAGATTTFTANSPKPGLCSFHASSPLATYEVTLETIDDGGVVRFVAFANQQTPNVNALVFMDTRVPQVRLFNSTGAAGTIRASLIRSGMGMLGSG